MRSEDDVRQAIAILGASFGCAELRWFVWHRYPEAEREARAAFQTLGWVAGAEESGFARALEYVALKLEQHTREEEKNHAS